MSAVLYYSTLCKNSQNLLNHMSTNNLGSNLHFVKIDNRIQKNNNTYVVLDNGQELLLPSAITKVPALMLLNDNYQVIYGKDILSHLKPEMKTYKQVVSSANTEPSAFSLSGLGDIVSDSFSFLDQGADELSAKGNGGLRQIHQYSTLNQSDSITTPEETYQANTIGNQNLDIDTLRRQRDNEINLQ